MEDVRDAVILAGGRGTRMLPASFFVPKETLPLVDTPIILHQIWEAARAGVTRVHIVLSEWKMKILRDRLNVQNLHSLDEEFLRASSKLGIDEVEIITHLQGSPGGVADAILLAAKKISGPFLVILGDNLLLEEHLGQRFIGAEYGSPASRNLVEDYKKFGLPCIGVTAISSERFSEFGIVKLNDGFVQEIVEKPSPNEAPSNLAICGRYLFMGNFADLIDQYPLSEYGEMQSIHIQKHLICQGGLRAVVMDGMTFYDSGNPYSWLKSQIDHAMKRPDIGPSLVKWLKTKIEDY